MEQGEIDDVWTMNRAMDHDDRTGKLVDLLEQEYNRRSPILSLGYIPKSAERDMPTMPEMSPRSASMKLLQLKSATVRSFRLIMSMKPSHTLQQ